jgi:hypothetical protein
MWPIAHRKRLHRTGRATPEGFAEMRRACRERFVPILQAAPPSVVIAGESVWKAGPHPRSKSGKGALPASELHAVQMQAPALASAEAGSEKLN